VLVILAVLASIVVVNFSSVTKKNNEAKAKTDISNLTTALGVYQADAGDYPPSLDALVSNPGNVAKWNGPYIQRGIPLDPWGHPYNYVYPGAHNTNGFDLSSNGDGHGNAEGLDNWTAATPTAH
jgi:general secretion pathway protein G